MSIQLKEVLNRGILEIPAIPVAVKCPPTATVKEAVQILKQSKIGSVIIADGLKVVGIFTERDFLMRVSDNPTVMYQEKITKVMTPNPICISKNETIENVLKKMKAGKFRHLILVDSYNNLERVVSIKDVLDYVVSLIHDLATTNPTIKKAA